MQPIEAYVPITQAGAQLVDIIRNIKRNGDTVAITQNGVPEAIILSYEKFDALLETMEILADKNLMSQIEHSKRDIEQGRLVDMDEAF